MGAAVKMTGTGAGATVEGNFEGSGGEGGIGAVVGAGTTGVAVEGVSVRGEFVAGDAVDTGAFVAVTTGATAGSEVAGDGIGNTGAVVGVEI